MSLHTYLSIYLAIYLFINLSIYLYYLSILHGYLVRTGIYSPRCNFYINDSSLFDIDSGDGKLSIDMSSEADGSELAGCEPADGSEQRRSSTVQYELCVEYIFRITIVGEVYFKPIRAVYCMLILE